MWSRRRLGMVLHRKDRQRAMPKPFDGTIVEVDVGNREIRRPLNSVDRPDHREAVAAFKQRRDALPIKKPSSRPEPPPTGRPDAASRSGGN